VVVEKFGCGDRSRAAPSPAIVEKVENGDWDPCDMPFVRGIKIEFPCWCTGSGQGDSMVIETMVIARVRIA
jgi:hypothetical protein